MVKQVTSTLITTASDSVVNVSSFESRIGKAARANLGVHRQLFPLKDRSPRPRVYELILDIMFNGLG